MSFLASNLNIHTMYELHELCMDINPKVGEQTYRTIFNTCFNLGFHKPKKDRCSVCIEFETATLQQLIRLEESFVVHQSNKSVAQFIKTNEKLLAVNEPEKRACLAFDLQKALNVPDGENGLFY